MKTSNQLEEQFRSWTPRRPSARLKRRALRSDMPKHELQPAQGVEEQTVNGRSMAQAWQWFAPAMAVFVLALGLSSPESNGFTQLISSPMTGRVSSLALEDAEISTYFAAHSSHNGWPIATFEWTNRSEPVTTTHPVTQSSSTNRLRR